MGEHTMFADEAGTVTFVCGYNMCGYMPDNEPHGCEDFEAARDCIVGDLETLKDGDDETDEEEIDEAIDWVMAQSGPFSLTLNGWSYWVAHAID
jgi:hypothetical protein